MRSDGSDGSTTVIVFASSCASVFLPLGVGIVISNNVQKNSTYDEKIVHTQVYTYLSIVGSQSMFYTGTVSIGIRSQHRLSSDILGTTQLANAHLALSLDFTQSPYTDTCNNYSKHFHIQQQALS